MRSNNYGPVVQRALLTSELQQLRRSRGETQEVVARDLEWSVSKLIRLEGGHVGVSRSDLEALLRHYGISDSEYIADQAERARKARQSGWWDKYEFSDKAFQAYVGYENDASSIRVTHGLLVSGLLQTEAYRRHIITAYGTPENEVDRRLAFSGHRQRILLEKAPKQHHILDEAVVRREVDDVMHDQLQQIVALSERPEITIQIIPFSAGIHPGMKGPFVILSFDCGLDDVLYLENDLHGDLVVAGGGGETVVGRGGDRDSRGAREIAECRDIFDRLTNVALSPAASVKLVKDLMRDKTLVTHATRRTGDVVGNGSPSASRAHISFTFANQHSGPTLKVVDRHGWMPALMRQGLRLATARIRRRLGIGGMPADAWLPQLALRW